MANPQTTARIREKSARLRSVVTILFVSLAVLLLLERFGAVALSLHDKGFHGEPLRRLAFELAQACPEIFYLTALWWIREALAAFARGEFYAPTITRMLERVGIVLAAGACLNVFVLPGVARLLGFGPGYWIAYDVSALVLGAIGLSLTIIAHVLQRASALQAELDEMF
jgi:hypothetical protein